MLDYSEISRLLRYYILIATNAAGSGHLTSSLSAADLLTVLYFKHFRYDFQSPHNLYNDRLIFSKGHATPLLYSLYKLANQITTEELLQYRKSNSKLQGHPTPDTPFIDVATGSLGMGLSYGLGMALAFQMKKSTLASLPKVYVLLGDGEMAEGQNYEAMQLASHYRADNLVGILDVNRLAETGETMVGHQPEVYAHRFQSFGWETLIVDGHDIPQIDNAFQTISENQTRPTMIIAKTIKGKGLSFLEDQPNRHGKVLKDDEYHAALQELALPETILQNTYAVQKPHNYSQVETSQHNYVLPTKALENQQFATRKAYGIALSELAQQSPKVLALDADLSDSTFSGLVQEAVPNQFLNMYIAEQNMISVAVGLSKLGYQPFVSTFSAFLTRAHDQLRMATLSQANMVLCGSHAGVSVGEDGPSGMGLDDISMFRSMFNTTILYPSDAVSTAKLLQLAAHQVGLTYLRTSRPPFANIYSSAEEFQIGGSKTLKSSPNDICAVVAAGITLHEALKASTELQNEGINIRIIDLYSIKPIDHQTLHKATAECNNTIICVEDHSVHGGLGDAVTEAFTNYEGQLPKILKLGIQKYPHSATSAQNLASHGISAEAIVAKVRELCQNTIKIRN
ncbi:MAG: transketolase [Patescibacteria group bacterium]|nr:MAG: transketolase [Patescibacteria group bacterium]